MDCLIGDGNDGIFDLDCIIPKYADGLIPAKYQLSIHGIKIIQKIAMQRISQFIIEIKIRKNLTLVYNSLKLIEQRQLLWKYIEEQKKKGLNTIDIGIIFKFEGVKGGHLNTVTLFVINQTNNADDVTYLAIRFEPHRHSSLYCRDSVRKYIRHLFLKEEDNDQFLYLDNLLIPDKHEGIQYSEYYQIQIENMTNEKVFLRDLKKEEGVDNNENISPLHGLGGFCSSWSDYATFILSCNKQVGIKKVTDYLLHFGVENKNEAILIYKKHCKLYQFMLYKAYIYMNTVCAHLEKTKDGSFCCYYNGICSYLPPIFTSDDQAKISNNIFPMIKGKLQEIEQRLTSHNQLNLGQLTVNDLKLYDPHRCRDYLVKFNDFSDTKCGYKDKSIEAKVIKECLDERLTGVTDSNVITSIENGFKKEKKKREFEIAEQERSIVVENKRLEREAIKNQLLKKQMEEQENNRLRQLEEQRKYEELRRLQQERLDKERLLQEQKALYLEERRRNSEEEARLNELSKLPVILKKINGNEATTYLNNAKVGTFIYRTPTDKSKKIDNKFVEAVLSVKSNAGVLNFNIFKNSNSNQLYIYSSIYFDDVDELVNYFRRHELKEGLMLTEPYKFPMDYDYVDEGVEVGGSIRKASRRQRRNSKKTQFGKSKKTRFVQVKKRKIKSVKKRYRQLRSRRKLN